MQLIPPRSECDGSFCSWGSIWEKLIHMLLERIPQSMNNCREIAQPYGMGVIAGHSMSNVGYPHSSYVSGWKYINECGQMCGPYMQQQLYEGLSTGFLPEELPVYPVVNGNVTNPVPLKYLNQFPVNPNWGASFSSIVPRETQQLACNLRGSCEQGGLVHHPSPYSQNESRPETQPRNVTWPETQLTNVTRPEIQPRNVTAKTAYGSSQQITPVGMMQSAPIAFPKLQSSEEPCWMFEDEGGRKHGPHSLAELYYWHNSSYLNDSLMVIQQQKMPMDLLRTSLWPIQDNLLQTENLSMPLLQGLAYSLKLLSRWFNVTLDVKLLDHLKKWLEREKLAQCQKAGDEPMLAACILP